MVRARARQRTWTCARLIANHHYPLLCQGWSAWEHYDYEAGQATPNIACSVGLREVRPATWEAWAWAARDRGRVSRAVDASAAYRQAAPRPHHPRRALLVAVNVNLVSLHR